MHCEQSCYKFDDSVVDEKYNDYSESDKKSFLLKVYDDTQLKDLGR